MTPIGWTIIALLVASILWVLLVPSVLKRRRDLDPVDRLVERLITDSIADQIAHESEMSRYNFAFRKDQRQQAILQRVVKKVGKAPTANSLKLILERIRARDQ